MSHAVTIFFVYCLPSAFFLFFLFFFAGSVWFGFCVVRAGPEAGFLRVFLAFILVLVSSL